MTTLAGFDQRLFSVVGLMADLVGAAIMLWSAHLSKKRANLLVYRMMEENAAISTGEPEELKAVLELLVKGSKWSLVGFGIIAVGSVFQILGVIPIS